MMKVIHSVSDTQTYVRELQMSGNKTIGFVPTMGALHKGHMSLVEQSVKNNEITVASIFINPRQFNDKSDFDNYPVNHENDLELLDKAGCDIVFLPSIDDIYKNFVGFNMDFNGLDKIYEGEFRPGHFQGVVDIVYRLFEIVQPNKAYFGLKDFQQLAIIKLMTKLANFNIEIVSCPIVREKSGLAMSSRNLRLSKEQFKNAANIYRLLIVISNKLKVGEDTDKYCQFFIDEIEKIPDMKAEYCVFCNPESLDLVKKINKNSQIIMCVAVWCGKIRLIDNIILVF
ncbi:MAG: pantoate--beta-alanine ligase [Bacteroidales bacterium]|nr:pantoate--beta-alanine ligase [Bacteroidales bacterium]